MSSVLKIKLKNWLYKDNVAFSEKDTVRKQGISLGKQITEDQWEEAGLEGSSCIFHMQAHKRKR